MITEISFHNTCIMPKDAGRVGVKMLGGCGTITFFFGVSIIEAVNRNIQATGTELFSIIGIPSSAIITSGNPSFSLDVKGGEKNVGDIYIDFFGLLAAIKQNTLAGNTVPSTASINVLQKIFNKQL